jgi:hypothetical protein
MWNIYVNLWMFLNKKHSDTCLKDVKWYFFVEVPILYIHKMNTQKQSPQPSFHVYVSTSLLLPLYSELSLLALINYVPGSAPVAILVLFCFFWKLDFTGGAAAPPLSPCLRTAGMNEEREPGNFLRENTFLCPLLSHWYTTHINPLTTADKQPPDWEQHRRNR